MYVSDSHQDAFLIIHNHRVVVHSRVNPIDYSTVSLRGVTRLLNGKEAEFTELEQWIKDYKHFQQLIKIKTFSKFRMWKAFCVWKKNVRWRYAGNCILLRCVYY